MATAKMSNKSTQVDLGKLKDNIDPELTVTIAVNGLVVKVSGRDSNDDWTNVTVVCNSYDDFELLVNYIKAKNG